MFSTASIDSIDVVFGAFWGISIGFMSSIIKFLLLLYILLPFSSSFGGFTGLISANSIIDTILHDSYFIIGILKEDGLLVIPGRVNSAVTFRLLNKGEFKGNCFELSWIILFYIRARFIVYYLFYLIIMVIFYLIFNLHYSLYMSFLTFSYINILGFLLFLLFLLMYYLVYSFFSFPFYLLYFDL